MNETALAVTFDELTVLSEQGVDVFVLHWSEEPEPPPYYVEVQGRRFHFTGTSFKASGHSALLSDWVRVQEAEGRTAMLVDRDARYYAYVHDPASDAEEGEE